MISKLLPLRRNRFLTFAIDQIQFFSYAINVLRLSRQQLTYSVLERHKTNKQSIFITFICIIFVLVYYFPQQFDSPAFLFRCFSLLDEYNPFLDGLTLNLLFDLRKHPYNRIFCLHLQLKFLFYSVLKFLCCVFPSVIWIMLFLILAAYEGAIDAFDLYV